MSKPNKKPSLFKDLLYFSDYAEAFADFIETHRESSGASDIAQAPLSIMIDAS